MINESLDLKQIGEINRMTTEKALDIIERLRAIGVTKITLDGWGSVEFPVSMRLFTTNKESTPNFIPAENTTPDGASVRDHIKRSLLND